MWTGRTWPTPWWPDMTHTYAIADERLQILLATPAHAAAITACVRAVRGEAYPNRLLYRTDDLARAISQGRLMIAIAVLPSTGQVVGMAALDCSAYGPVAELGMVMVLPSLRRLHIADDLRGLLIAQGQSQGLRGVYTEVLAPATDAPPGNLVGQTFAEREGVSPCGVTLGLWPSPDGGRQSFVRYLRPSAPGRVSTLCRLPARHQSLAAEILGRLGYPVEFVADGVVSGNGAVHTLHDPELSSWVLDVSRIGVDTASQLLSVITQIQANPAVTCAHLELPLAQPGAMALCELAEAQGFFFSTLTPHAFRDGPGLRLQWLAAPIDPTQLALLNPLAQRIAHYQAQEQFRVRPRASMIAA